LDVLKEHIQDLAPRCILFADDVVLLGESREELNGRLETWRQALEAYGFRLSRSKTEHMECNFSKRRIRFTLKMKVGDHIIPQVTWFKYLGSIVQNDGEIEADVSHRIQAGWLKWRRASCVLCDKKVQLKLKRKFYRTAVRSSMLFGTECWAPKSQHENQVSVAELRMLRWMIGKTRHDMIRNDIIRERERERERESVCVCVWVAHIVEKLVENRLRWFEYVKRKLIDVVVRRVDQMKESQVKGGRGKPRKTIRETIKKDLEVNELNPNLIYDTTLWRNLIHIADPT